jgi:hypothetical protein
MNYLGDFAAGAIVTTAFNSSAAGGASVTLATNGTVSVYRNSETAQSTTGVTVTEDFDGLTGVHWVSIDTGADATFFAVGNEYLVVLSGATIDGQAVNAALAQFSLVNRSAPTVAQIWAGVTAAAGNFLADHVLRRALASAEASAAGDALSFRSLIGAIAKLVNRVTVGGTTLTVYETDDTTALGTQTVTTSGEADPITGVETD